MSMFVRTVYEDHYQHILKRASDAEAALTTAQAEIEKLRGENERQAAALAYWEQHGADPQAEEMRKALEEAILQIEYLHEKFSETGSGNGVLTRLRTALSLMKGGESNGR